MFSAFNSTIRIVIQREKSLFSPQYMHAHTYKHLQLLSLNNTDIETRVGNGRFRFLRTKEIRGRPGRSEGSEDKAEGRRRGMDEEVRGRRKLGAETETASVEKGQRRQRACAREKIKNRRKRWKSMPCSFTGEELPPWCCCFRFDTLMIKRWKPLLALHALTN